jgi:hypothetical protein
VRQDRSCWVVETPTGWHKETQYTEGPDTVEDGEWEQSEPARVQFDRLIAGMPAQGWVVNEIETRLHKAAGIYYFYRLRV